MSRLNTFLKGIKVLDLTQYLPGPLATLLLSDMGAEVLKIEPPAGDEMRKLGPRDAAGNPIYFSAINAGKTTRVMNLKDAQTRLAFLDLVKSVDILFEGFRPGVMDRLGLSYQTLSAINPGLIYCSISGFGKNSPLAQAAAHDANYLALSGALDRNGALGPSFFDPPLSDCTSSLTAISTVLGALYARERDGKGCEIDIAIADVIMPFQTFPLADLGVRGEVPRRQSTYLNGGVAYYQIYATRDGGHVALGSIEPKFWRAFCEAAGHPEWIGRQAEAVPQQKLIGDLASYFSTLTLSEINDRFGSVDCCLTPVLDLDEAVQSPHHSRRGLIHRNPSLGHQALFPALIDGKPPVPREPLLESAKRAEAVS